MIYMGFLAPNRHVHKIQCTLITKHSSGGWTWSLGLKGVGISNKNKNNYILDNQS